MFQYRVQIGRLSSGDSFVGDAGDLELYASLKVVLLSSTQHLIPQWSGCITAAHDKERRKSCSEFICHCTVWLPKTVKKTLCEKETSENK